MQLSDGSILSYSPDNSRTWILNSIDLNGNAVKIPLIGFAVVVTFLGEGDEGSETELQPVVIGHENRPETGSDFRRYHRDCEGKGILFFTLELTSPENWERAYNEWAG